MPSRPMCTASSCMVSLCIALGCGGPTPSEPAVVAAAPDVKAQGASAEPIVPTATVRPPVVRRKGALPEFPPVDGAVKRVLDEVVAVRRKIHENPELGERENETAALVVERLRELGLEVRTGLAKTGVVGVLEGGQPGGVVAWRSDMDALPVTEATGLPFASKKTDEWEGKRVGVMHACGHDVHTAVGLGVAEVLADAEVRKHVKGKVLFLFQPAEEGVPGVPGDHGAKLMMADGAFSDPRPQAVMGFHTDSRMSVGDVGVVSGGIMAATDRFEITVKGRQAHGAYPQDSVDALVIASHIVVALQTIASRNIDTRDTVVVTVGQFDSGNRYNIIPGDARLVGTIRTHDDAVQDQVHARVRKVAGDVASAFGGSVEVTIDELTPVTWNDPELLEAMRPVFARIVGAAHVKDERPHMGGEDFSFYAKEVPGLFYLVGVGNPKKGITGLSHTPEFAVDEDSIEVALRTGANLVLTYLDDLASAQPR